MTFHSTSLATLITASALLGCWTGAESEGLPCIDNTHCGVGLDCVAGFCGGEPSDALCGNGYVDPGEVCDEGALNSDNGACRLDCTLEICGDGFQGPSEACDLGEQNDDRGDCKTDCTPEVCGDGLQGPTEACDGSIDCSPECTFESCGNGVLDPGEACDGGGESADCDDDCTAVECEDTNLNEAAGEQCNYDPRSSQPYLCLSNCTIPLLWDDMEIGTPPVAWSHEKVSGGALVTDDWSLSNRKALGMRAWDSGMPAAAAGDTRLITPTLDLSSLAGETIELRFDHARVFGDCDEPTVPHEGGVVEVSVDGGPYQVITPDGGYTGLVGDGLCIGPLEGEPAFILDADYVTEAFDLSAYAGSSIEIGFRVAWDCGNCPGDETARGWFIDNVVVQLE